MKNCLSASIRNVLALAILSLTLASCEKQETLTISRPGDYYPTQTGSTWTYQYTWTAKSDSSSYVFDQGAGKDTLYEGKLYIDFGLQLVRKENGNYYRRTNLYGIGEEFIFLKDNLPVGGTWPHSSSENHKAEFIIKAIHREKMVEGKNYKDVIEVQKQTFYKNAESAFILGKTITSFYARGIGEIYSFEEVVYEKNSHETKLISYQLK